MVTWARESKILILPLILGHRHLLLQLHLPKFRACCFFLELRRSWCCQYNVWIKSIKVQMLQVCSFLVVDVSDFCLGGLRIAFLVFIARDPPSWSPHINCCLPSPPSWLQLLMTFLVVVILILVVWILHLLCFYLLQLFVTFLVVVFMLIVVFFLLLRYRALLMTLLVIVILISVVWILHFLCLHFLQVLATFLVIVLMLVVVLLFLLFSYSW